MKKLYKSEHDKVWMGIIGGLGEYSETDPVVLRLAFLLIVVVTGIIPGVIAYIIAGMIVPKKPIVTARNTETNSEPPETGTEKPLF